MQVSGTVLVKATLDEAAAALRDADLIGSVIPACRSIKAVGNNAYEARLEYHGAVKLGLDLALTYTPVSDRDFDVDLRAGSLITGRVNSRTRLSLAPAPDGCTLAWSGNLEASGLAHRLIQGQEARIAARTNRMFRELGEKVEARVAAPGTGTA